MVKDNWLSEIVLRKYERVYEMDRRQLVRKICLSIGLLQPGDGRDVIVDILGVLIEAQKKGEKLSSDLIRERVEKMRKENNLELKGIAESNIRRQLKRLMDLMIIDRKENFYYLSENERLSRIFEDKIEKFVIEPAIKRIKEYLEELDKEN